MQNELDINPNMIQHHTRCLKEAGLIEEAHPGFKLTNAGRAVMTMSLEEMIDTAKLAVDVVKKSEEKREQNCSG